MRLIPAPVNLKPHSGARVVLNVQAYKYQLGPAGVCSDDSGVTCVMSCNTIIVCLIRSGQVS